MPNPNIITFTKMSGAGNDFIILEEQRGMNYRKLAPKVCDRTNGIGADGILLLGKSRKADYRMRIINSDGSEAEMCGNGARCLAAYIAARRKPRKKTFSIETLAGVLLAEAKGETADIRLSAPKDFTPSIEIMISGQRRRVHYIDTGVPHTVLFVDNLKSIDVRAIGPALRYHERFAPRGTNVNFAEQINPTLVAVRTYERGVEDETKACGTGAVACAIIASILSRPGRPKLKNARMRVLTVSGEILTVTFNMNDDIICLLYTSPSPRDRTRSRMPSSA